MALLPAERLRIPKIGIVVFLIIIAPKSHALMLRSEHEAEYAKLLNQAREKDNKINALSNEIENHRKQANDLVSAKAKLESDLQKTTATLEILKSDKQNLENALKSSEENAAAMQKERENEKLTQGAEKSELEASIAATRSEISTKNSEITRLQEEITKTEQALIKAEENRQTEIVEFNSRFEEEKRLLEGQISDKEQQLNEKNEILDSLRELDLSRNAAELVNMGNRDRLITQNKTLLSAIMKMKQRINEETQSKDKITTTLKQLKAIFDKSMRANHESERANMAYVDNLKSKITAVSKINDEMNTIEQFNLRNVDRWRTQCKTERSQIKSLLSEQRRNIMDELKHKWCIFHISEWNTHRRNHNDHQKFPSVQASKWNIPQTEFNRDKSRRAGRANYTHSSRLPRQFSNDDDVRKATSQKYPAKLNAPPTTKRTISALAVKPPIKQPITGKTSMYITNSNKQLSEKQINTAIHNLLNAISSATNGNKKQITAAMNMLGTEVTLPNKINEILRNFRDKSDPAVFSAAISKISELCEKKQLFVDESLRYLFGKNGSLLLHW